MKKGLFRIGVVRQFFFHDAFSYGDFDKIFARISGENDELQIISLCTIYMKSGIWYNYLDEYSKGDTVPLTQSKKGKQLYMKEELQENNLSALFEAVLVLQNQAECYAFFKDLCTYQELNAIAQRLQVAKMLHAGEVVHAISAQTGVSTATISRVNRAIKDGMGGYQLIFDRICDAEGESK